MRVKATIAYDGSKFFGFQRQSQTNKTVVEHIENALKSIGINSKVVGSGRTDRGVHATGQVIHFDIPIYWQNKSLIELKNRLNQKLRYINFKYIKEVDENFHAQYSAKIRIYRYLIKTTQPNVFEKDFISYYKIDNIKLFKDALNLYIGEHNFKYFKKEGSITSSDIREIKKIKSKKVKNYYAIYIYANGYLRSQVRMMIEGALRVERGLITLNNLKEQIKGKKRYFTTLAKPEGLYLFKVIY